MVQTFTGDLVCWDFGDTLVDELFMRAAPRECPEWTQAFEQMVADRPDLFDAWDLGRATVNDAAIAMRQYVDLTPKQIARQMTANFADIHWFPEVRTLVERLARTYTQAVVTVNPHEYWAFAAGIGLMPLVDVHVTSAEVASASKVVMVERAREVLALPPGIDTSLLIDNKAHNIDEFTAGGGQGWWFRRDRFEADAVAVFGDVAVQR